MIGPYSSCSINGDPRGTGAASGAEGMGDMCSGIGETGISMRTRAYKGVEVPPTDSGLYLVWGGEE